MSGIACAGNWIVDQIKVIDSWPEKGELVNIRSFRHGIGGSPANVLTDLHSLGFAHPTMALGCVGRDQYGDLVLEHCASHGIDSSLIRVLEGENTSYTDVMTLAGTGDRTFFQYRGANARFSPELVDMNQLAAMRPRLFHLGYLLLLDGMDEEDPDYGTAAGRLLSDVAQNGIETSVDVVSEASDRFERVVQPTLRYVDHCIVNEYEAEQTTGTRIRSGDGSIDRGAIASAAQALISLGVRSTAVIHCPDGGQWCDSQGREIWMPSLRLSAPEIVSAVGAGDAFCAGILYGIHEGWSPESCLSLANATAAMCLRAYNTTDGVGSLEEAMRFATSRHPRS